MVVMFPVMAMLVISLVTTMDVKNVNVAVVDLDKSETSRRIISDMEASANLTLSLYAGMYEDALRAVEKGDADVILQIPAEYEKELWAEREKASEEIVRSSGCEITELSAEEKERFREAVKPMYEEYCGSDMDIIEAIIKAGK